MKVLNQKFFERDTEIVAKELLGKYLVRKIGKKEVRAIITEVEVYDGFRDRASHASRGRTERNAPMFGPAGHWYVYFTYGMHWMLNIITRERGYPAAVLIRSAATNADKRGLENGLARMINGPARVTKFLKIDRRLNGKIASKKSGLWIAAMKGRASFLETGVGRIKIKTTGRIGIQFAGPYWSKRRWRFYIREKSSKHAIKQAKQKEHLE